MLLEKICLTVLLTAFLIAQSERSSLPGVALVKRCLSPVGAIVLLVASICYRNYYGIKAPAAAGGR